MENVFLLPRNILHFFFFEELKILGMCCSSGHLKAVNYPFVFLTEVESIR